MELPTFKPGAGLLPPPSVSQDQGEPKVPAPVGGEPAGTGSGAPPPLFPAGSPNPLEPRPPVVPVPPAPTNPGGVPTVGVPTFPTGPALPTLPAFPGTPGAPTLGNPFPSTPVNPGAVNPPLPGVGPNIDNPLSLGNGNLRPVPASVGALPGKVTQTVTLEAICPESVVFGSEFRYELIVKNSGTAPVNGVRVEDDVPAGAKYIGSDPPAEANADHLSWAVGTLEPGAEKRIAVRVKPADEGEIRSRATVVYSAAVDAKTKVTRPRIAVNVTAAEVCKAGEEMLFQIKVTNSGTGPAQKMVLQAFLSEGMLHTNGAKLELPLDNLPPGETKLVPLKAIAAKAGLQWCQITVGAQGSQDATAKASVNVVEALLQVTQTGPAKCMVRSEPEYTINLANPGTATTDPVMLYAVIPEGFDYLSASDNASYSEPHRAVVWKMAGIAPGGSKAFKVKVRATTAGDGLLRTIAQAVPEQVAPAVAGAGGAPAVRPVTRVLEAKTETAIKAEGVAAVRFEVRDLDDPVEVGKEAVYEIRVINQGTGACTNVQLVAAMAEGTAYTGSSGPTQVKAQGQNLVFDPIPTLAVKGEAVYQVKIRGATAGDMRFRVQLSCDQVRAPVVKEESTRFVKE